MVGTHRRICGRSGHVADLLDHQKKVIVRGLIGREGHFYLLDPKNAAQGDSILHSCIFLKQVESGVTTLQLL